MRFSFCVAASQAPVAEYPTASDDPVDPDALNARSAESCLLSASLAVIGFWTVSPSEAPPVAPRENSDEMPVRYVSGGVQVLPVVSVRTMSMSFVIIGLTPYSDSSDTRAMLQSMFGVMGYGKVNFCPRDMPRVVEADRPASTLPLMIGVLKPNFSSLEIVTPVASDSEIASSFGASPLATWVGVKKNTRLL